MRKYIHLVILVLFTLFFFYIINKSPLGILPDSLDYIETSRNIKLGNGVVDDKGELVNHWPPGYSLILAGFSFIFNSEIIESAKYLNTISYFLFGLIMFLIFKELRIKQVPSIFLLLFLMSSRPITEYLIINSESVFVTILSIMVWLFIKWINRKQMIFLLFSGLFCGILLLTRYAAFGFIIGIILYLLTKRDLKLNEKIKISFLFLLPSFIFFLIWLIYTNSFGYSSVDRQFVFHLIPLKKVKTGLFTIVSWFVINYRYLILFIVFFLILLIYSFKTKISLFRPKEILVNLRLPFFLIFFYICFLIFSISYFDFQIPLNNRLLSPLIVPMLILMGIFLNYFYVNYPLKLSLSLFLLIVINSNISSFYVWKNHFVNGSGFTAKRWHNSETINFISKFSKDSIFTNGHEVIKLYTKHIPISIPSYSNSGTGELNNLFHDHVAAMKSGLVNNKSKIIYFENITWRWYLMSKQDILEEFKDFEISYFTDGFVIYSKI